MGKLRFGVGLVFFVAALWTSRAQLFTPSGVRFGTLGAATARTFLSPNKAYELNLENGANAGTSSEVPLVATMSKVEGAGRTVLWATRFTGREVQYLADDDVMVGDSGEFFVTTRGSQNEIELHRKERAFTLHRRTYGSESLFLSPPERITAIDQVDGQEIIRIWRRENNQWEIHSVVDGKRLPNPTPELAEKWNEATRKEIRERISAAKLEIFRRKVKEKAAPVAKLADVAMGRGTNVIVSQNDYEFLVLQRNPEDRKLVEDLFRVDEDRPWWHGESSWNRIADFVATDFVRANADWLLGIWDKKVTPGMIPARSPVESMLPRFHLGKVMGRVNFAGPINLTKPAPPAGIGAWSGPMLRFRLVPVDSARGTVERIDDAMWSLPAEEDELVDEATFAFTTTLPGTYELKVIWDKRSPYSEEVGPGDYVGSAGPIEVTAGGVITNIVVYCTNQIKGGEPYYAADEMVRHKWKVTGELSRNSMKPDREGRMDIFWRAAPYWIVATNKPASSNYAQLVSMGTTTFGPVRGVEIPRPDRFVLIFKRERNWRPDPKANFDGPSDLWIYDERGCAYRHMFYHESPSTIRYTFFHFPRSAKTWRLVGYSAPLMKRTDDQPILFDFTVTNLVATAKREMTPSELPIELDLGAVKMRVTEVTREYIEPTITAEFFHNGEPAKDWHIQEAIVADADGNFMNPLDMCGEEKGLRVIGRLRNHLKGTSLPFEFSVSRRQQAAAR